MKQDNDGAHLLEQGDIVDYRLDSGFSPPFEVMRDGPGDDSSYVALTGFATGTGVKVKAKIGAEIRGVFTEGRPDVGDYTAEERTQKRNFLSVVDDDGQKVLLGSVPEL